MTAPDLFSVLSSLGHAAINHDITANFGLAPSGMNLDFEPRCLSNLGYAESVPMQILLGAPEIDFERDMFASQNGNMKDFAGWQIPPAAILSVTATPTVESGSNLHGSTSHTESDSPHSTFSE